MCLAAKHLPEPWLIEPRGIDNLALRLHEAPEFVAEARGDPEAMIAAIRALSFGKKVALLNLAVQEQEAAMEVAGSEAQDRRSAGKDHHPSSSLSAPGT